MDKPSSESLAAIIVTSRVLGLFSEDSKKCMSELLKRKDEGDIFDYESYISNQIKIIEDTNNKSKNDNGFMKLLSSLSSMGKI
jgi:hypothetical protein